MAVWMAVSLVDVMAVMKVDAMVARLAASADTSADWLVKSAASLAVTRETSVPLRVARLAARLAGGWAGGWAAQLAGDSDAV